MPTRPTFLDNERYEQARASILEGQLQDGLSTLRFPTLLEDGLKSLRRSAFGDETATEWTPRPTDPLPIVVSERPQFMATPTIPGAAPMPTGQPPRASTTPPAAEVADTQVAAPAQAPSGQPEALPQASAQPAPPAVAPSPPTGGGLRSHAEAMASKYGLPWEVFDRQLNQESSYRTDAVSSAGASGPGQFMPATGNAVARQMGVTPEQFWASPELQVEGAALHMRDLLAANGGDIRMALAAYNAGQGNVDKYGEGVFDDDFAAGQTRDYVNIILGPGASQRRSRVSLNAGAAPAPAAPPPPAEPPAGGPEPAAGRGSPAPSEQLWSPDAPASPQTAYQMGTGRNAGGVMLRAPLQPTPGDAFETEAPVMGPGDGGYAPTPEPSQPAPPNIDPAEGGARIPEPNTLVMAPPEEPLTPPPSPYQPEQAASMEPQPWFGVPEETVTQRIQQTLTQAAQNAGTAAVEASAPPTNALEVAQQAVPTLKGLNIVQSAMDQFGATVGRQVAASLGWTDEEMFSFFGMPVSAQDVGGMAGSVLLDPTNLIPGGQAGSLTRVGARAAQEGLETAGGAVRSGARALGEAAQDVGTRVSRGLEANAERVAALDAQMAQQGSTVAPSTVGVAPETRRFYHGTASDFPRPDPEAFAESGLFGPGYYTTSDPRIASSYAEVRGTPSRRSVSDLQAQLDRVNDQLADPSTPESQRRALGYAQQNLTQRITIEENRAGPNIRAVDIPPDLSLLNIERQYGDGVSKQISDYLFNNVSEDAALRFDESIAANPTGNDLYEALVRAGEGDKTWANTQLQRLGVDGITHKGGQNTPLMDADGNPIEHDVTVVFPGSLDKIRNAFSGEVGGATIGPVPSTGSDILARVNADIGSSIGSSTFGAAAGAALPADSDEERRANALTGAGIGLVGGPAASRFLRSRGGALATPGVSPQPQRGIQGQQAIKATEAAEVGRLRLDKFPEEVRDIIEASARDQDFARTQRRGVLPDRVVQALADEDGRTVEQLIRSGKAGKAWNAEETVALRNAVSSQSNTVRELSEEISQARAAGVTPDLLIARRAAESKLLDGLVKTAEGARAEAGRALRQYRQEARLIELNPEQAIQQIYKRLGGRDTAEQAVDEYTKLVQDGADPIQLAKFWAKIEAGKITASDLFSLYRRFNMLSGPRTVEVNALSGAVNLGYEVATQALGQVAKGRLSEAGAEFAAPLKAAGRAFTNMAETMRHGVSMEQATRGDIPRTLSSRTDNRAAKAGLTVMELPDRFNAGVDQFYRTMTEDWAATVLAQRQARDAKLTPRSKGWSEAVAANLEAIRDDPTKFPQIKEMADHVTFSEEPGAVGKGLEAFRRQAPLVANLVMPFIRTPYNIASRAVDMSPLGIARTAIEAGTGVGRGRTNLSPRIRDNLIGTGAAIWAYNEATQGNITGAGPDDPEKVAQLRATGWQPYSVKIGNEYWSYANFAPFSLTLSLAAAAHEAQQYKKPDKGDALNMLSDGAARTAKVVTDMTVLAGIGAIVKSIQDPDRYGTQWLSQFLQTLIPAGSALNTVGQATDPQIRRAERTDVGTQVSQNLLARIPPNPLTPDRTDVPAAQDPLGRPVPNEQTGFGALNPFRPTTERTDPAIQAFLDAGVDIGKPKQQLSIIAGGVPIELTPAEQRRWNELRGSILAQNVPNVAADQRYQEADKLARGKGLQRMLAASATAADNQLKAEIGGEEISRRLREATQKRRAS